MAYDFSEILTGVKQGTVVPYLGAYALNGSVHAVTGQPIPADSDSLIYAMNDGKPMAPKLMYEFPRAAMNQELKRGRSFVTKFLTKLYGENQWTISPVHRLLADLNLPYVIDINRDTHLQKLYAQRAHILIVGVARLAGTDYRFRLYHFAGEGASYQEVTLEQAVSLFEQAGKKLPILFKPMGTPLPDANFIASDADYVDYITELMGGFSIPSFLKEHRQQKRYLLMGLRLNRDSERMVLSDIIYSAAPNPTGWALIPEPNDKELRFCKRIGIEVIQASADDFIAAAQGTAIAA